ncbi:hypothetical protein Baya_6613 [Bagarius yarrelli]|uniref:WKF domain-containing protein n=1 Tax=Bagarius yarrelli TaxID=175774 RepID=A0A556U1D3_BAGYA|nr:hypothetical protein Baya_6613 [Bagarius yarrelli]
MRKSKAESNQNPSLCVTVETSGSGMYTLPPERSTSSNSVECVSISEVTKKKKKKDDMEHVDTTGGCANDELNGTKACEAVHEVKKKKKKKVKKEKNVHSGIAESTDLMKSCTNEELDDKKRKKDKHKQPVITEKDEIEEEEGLENEEEEELSPEERRVLERKLKKIRKKEEKKKQKELAVSEKDDSKSSIAQTQALEYLTCWSEKRDEWKFQKTRQVWLLQHMYDSEKVPDTHFSVLLSYLEGLQGVAREITAQKAEALVRFGAGPEAEEGGAAEAQKKTERAREVTQILS